MSFAWDNCCTEATGAKMAALIANQHHYDPLDVTFPDLFPVPTGSEPFNAYRSSTIHAFDGYGHTFDQSIVFGRYSDRLLVGTTRINSDGGTDYNIIVDTFNTLVSATQSRIEFSWLEGTAHAGGFVLELGDIYTPTMMLTDLEELYGMGSLDDVTANMIRWLSWTQYPTVLGQQNYLVHYPDYFSPGLVFDAYAGETLGSDDRDLIDTMGTDVNNPGFMYAEADRLGVTGEIIGEIFRGLPTDRHCYRDGPYDGVSPLGPTIGCAEIDADVSHIVRVAPPAMDTTDTIYNYDMLRQFVQNKLPSSGSPGCGCTVDP